MYYADGRLNIFFENSFVISVKEDIPELETPPVDMKLLKDILKKRLIEYHNRQLKRISNL